MKAGLHRFSREFPGILREHLDHLRCSAISDKVIKERGYKSIVDGQHLAVCGFASTQRRMPGILLPILGPDGSLVGHQYRPDNPRIRREKPVKYETPLGAHIRIDVPPVCRRDLANPSIDLWVTEGIKKADALASNGFCALDLLGIWGFKGKNSVGGTVFQADFDYVAFEGRTVIIAYDSDISTKPQVRKAMERLAEHLKRKGASTYYVQLPEEGTAKVGVDDFLMIHMTCPPKTVPAIIT